MVSSPAMPRPHRSTFRIASYDVAPDHRASLAALLRYLHDGAQAHAAGEGFGYRELYARQRAWALVAIDLAVGERPAGGADLEAVTAVAQASGPLVWRDYRALTGGRPFAEGQSLWALIDLASRTTPTPAPDLRAALDRIAAPLQSRAGWLRRVTARAVTREHHARTALTHDCDFNGHLNNVVAAGWLLDAAYEVLAEPGDRRSVPAVSRLWLSYHHEVLKGQSVEVWSGGEGEEVYVEWRRAGGGPRAVNGVVYGPDTPSATARSSLSRGTLFWPPSRPRDAM